MHDSENRNESQNQYGTDEPGQGFYCQLFSDMVTKRLCMLRRRELEAGGGFSCAGCFGADDTGTTQH